MADYTLQHTLDIKKWLESEAAGTDKCGLYEFCAYCDKGLETPCADAYAQMQYIKSYAPQQQVAAETQAEPETEQNSGVYETSLGKKFDYGKVMEKKANRKSLSFAEKYALSDEIVKTRYADLQKALTATGKDAPKIKSRISKQCDTYRRGGYIVAKITIIGSSLRLNLPLDPAAPEFNDGRTPHVDAGKKKVYNSVPFQFKVNSKLALKRALALIELIK